MNWTRVEWFYCFGSPRNPNDTLENAQYGFDKIVSCFDKTENVQKCSAIVRRANKLHDKYSPVTEPSYYNCYTVYFLNEWNRRVYNGHRKEQSSVGFKIREESSGAYVADWEFFFSSAPEAGRTDRFFFLPCFFFPSADKSNSNRFPRRPKFHLFVLLVRPSVYTAENILKSPSVRSGPYPV